MVLVICHNQDFDGSRERRACWRCPLKVDAHLTHFLCFGWNGLSTGGDSRSLSRLMRVLSHTEILKEKE
jgi:hypothetical protein